MLELDKICRHIQFEAMHVIKMAAIRFSIIPSLYAVKLIVLP